MGHGRWQGRNSATGCHFLFSSHSIVTRWDVARWHGSAKKRRDSSEAFVTSGKKRSYKRPPCVAAIFLHHTQQTPDTSHSYCIIKVCIIKVCAKISQITFINIFIFNSKSTYFFLARGASIPLCTSSWLLPHTALLLQLLLISVILT